MTVYLVFFHSNSDNRNSISIIFSTEIQALKYMRDRRTPNSSDGHYFTEEWRVQEGIVSI